MSDDGIGRLLVASLHQGIGDVLPTRLDYYEHWLSPMGLREGRSGLAPLGAVLSFLRQEGEASYTAVMAAAGRSAAEWHCAESGYRMPARRWQPRWLRRRAALTRARRLLRAAYQPVVVTTVVGRGRATVTLTGNVFCSLREPWPWPTCGWVTGALARLFELHGLDAVLRIETCRAQGAPACGVAIDFTGRAAGESA